MSELIDRQTTKELFCKRCDVVVGIREKICKESGCWIIKQINEMPTIDAVPVVHGRWKDYPDCGVTACSACGWSIEECFYDPTTLKPYPYCPNCGARMDGGKDDI